MQTPSETDLGFPTKGSLKRVPFYNLLREIAAARTTGSLYLLNGETKKVVFFVDGRPTVVRSNLATEFLGQILTDQGLITQEQCDNTLEAIRRTGKKQGELLVEMGILSEGNLRYGLEEQLRIKLFELFTWDEGRFQFKEGAEPGNAGTPPAGTTEGLIIAAIQERFSDERAREVLRVSAERYPGPSPKWGGDPSHLDLLPEELYFLKCLDGSRTTDEVLSRKLDLEVPQVSTLLLGLLSAGVVDALDAKLPRRLPPARPNLAPPSIPEDQLLPSFEVTSSIGEYEDTPLPSRLSDLGASSSKNPRVPLLPTEDEEMFRGLNVDESIVTDSRSLIRAVERSASGLGGAPARPAAPAPAPDLSVLDPLGDETDFSDLQAAVDEDDERPMAAPAPATVKPESGKHRLGPPPGLASLRKETTPAPVAPAPAPAPVAAADDLPDLGDLGDDEDALPEDLPDLGEDIEELDDIDDELLDEDDDAAGEDGDDAADDDDAPAYPTLDGDDALSLSAAQAMPDDDLGLADGGPQEPGDLGDLGDLAADSTEAPLDELDDDIADDLLDGVDDDLLLAGDDGELPELEDLDDLELDADLDADDLGGDDLGGDDLAGDDFDAELGGEEEFEGDDGGYADDGYDGEPALGSAESTFVGEVEGEGAAGDGMDAYGATRYSEAEAAMREGDYDTAVALFEDAYNAGFDVAELHAHLAFARYRASGGDPDIANNSLELLDYAEGIDPGLAILHAYRGAIYVGLGMTEQARECIERALYLDPYCELALEYRDSV